LKLFWDSGHAFKATSPSLAFSLHGVEAGRSQNLQVYLNRDERSIGFLKVIYIVFFFEKIKHLAKNPLKNRA